MHVEVVLCNTAMNRPQWSDLILVSIASQPHSPLNLHFTTPLLTHTLPSHDFEMASDIRRAPLQESGQESGSQNNTGVQSNHDLRCSLSGTTMSGGSDDSSYDVCEFLNVLRKSAKWQQYEKLVQFLAPAAIGETSPSHILKTLCKDIEQPVCSSLGDRCRFHQLVSLVKD